MIHTSKEREENNMRIIKVKNYDEVSVKTANLILGQVNLKPDAVLGLATGGSPVGAYKKIVEAYNNGEVDFSGVTTINLDEYRGIKRNHEQSYWSFMQENLFKHVNVREDHIFIPNGENLNSEEVCREYDKIIENAGGIDMQLLGIGLDGHIGFNEPSDSFAKETHCVDLTENTIQANARFFSFIEEVPTQAYTTGIKNIMQARHILLIASGEAKADALYEAVYGPITPHVPASILQLHDEVSVVADEAALSRIIKEGLI